MATKTDNRDQSWKRIAGVTTGLSEFESEPCIAVTLDDSAHNVKHMTADQARRLGCRLIVLAGALEEAGV